VNPNSLEILTGNDDDDLVDIFKCNSPIGYFTGVRFGGHIPK